MNAENLKLQITEEIKSNKDDETFEIKQVNAENNLDYYPYNSEVAKERRHMVDFIGKLKNELKVRQISPYMTRYKASI